MKESKKQSASFFKELGGFMTPYKGAYSLSVVLSVVAVMCELATYGFVGKIAGMIFDGNYKIESILPIVGIMALCKITNALLVNISTMMSHGAAYNTLSDIRTAFSDKMMKLPLGYFEKNGSGRLKTLLVDRVESIEITLAHLLPELTGNLLSPVALILWMFFVDWRLTLCMLLWIFLGLVTSSGMMIGYEKQYTGQITAEKSMNQAVIEYVGGIEVIKTFNQTDSCYKKYRDAVTHNAKFSVNWAKSVQIFSSLSYSIMPLSLIPVAIAGLLFYDNGTISASSLFFFMIISLGIVKSIMKASVYFDQLAQMGTVAREIREVLDYPELNRKADAEDSPNISNFDIDILNLKFAYSHDSEEVITDISLNIPEKTMLALVGPSGSGKSTIAKLLAGYWEATGGEIKIGNKPLSEYSQETLNKAIAYVDQDTFLFELSIMDNIRLGQPKATDDEVIQTAIKSGCHEFIRALPDGYHTQTGVAGGRLSGGERQRIAIARAMMKNAPIMILDEATASSDPENESAIQSALSATAINKTLIVIAHRLSTITSADQIAYIEKGRIKGLGTHNELFDSCPAYKQMWILAEKGVK